MGSFLQSVSFGRLVETIGPNRIFLDIPGHAHADVKLGGERRELVAAAGVTAELVSFRNFLSTTSPPVQRR